MGQKSLVVEVFRASRADLDARLALDADTGTGVRCIRRDRTHRTDGCTVTKTGDVGTIAGGETAVVKFVNAMSGGDNPTPTPDPTPDHNGGGGHGGHGGGSGSGSKKSSTTTASGPAAEPTEPVTPVEPEPQPVVPEEGLPKTGEDQMNVPMTALTVGMMAAAYVLMTGRKKTEE